MIGWYRRTFQVPAEWAPGRTILRFGAVGYRAEVWLNGVEVGTHDGGYTRFEFVVDTAVRARTNS